MKSWLPLLALLSLISAQLAHADQGGAAKCASALPPSARLVFNAVRADPELQTPLRTVLAARVRKLVFTDRLTMKDAHPAAEAASECLRILRNCNREVC